MTVLLTGGTGTLGSRVTPLLLDAGAKLRVLSRTARESGDGVEFVTGDLLQNKGIEAAVDGVEVIAHLAGGQKGDDIATRNLLAAAKRAGVRHIVYISVTGADRVPLKWFRTKLDSELAIQESGIAWTILRAAQFDELTFDMLRQLTKLPVVLTLSGLRLQPVDARDVAQRLAALIVAAPAGRVPDLVGPQVYPMAELARSYLRAVGKRRPMLRIRIPGKAGRAYRVGANLSLDGVDVGTRTWAAFLTERGR